MEGDQESTVSVYDISGHEPVLGEIPHDQVQDAIASGKFSFPKGATVPTVAPDGTHGTIPADQAPVAFSNGYQYATPKMQAAQAEQDKYGTRPQQFATALEGAAQGLAGPLAPMAERALGVPAEDIRKRAEVNPWTHGLSEAAGFGGGLFTGASEAALVGKAGEAASGALNLGAEGAGIASRIAAGAVKAGTEMSLIQGSDEATKAITQDPNQSIGSAAINVGLSGLLGSAGGAALSGTGMLLGSAVKATGIDTALKEFTDRLAYRGANLNPNEAMQNEVESAVNSYHAMGSELGGAEGIKSRALREIMPEMNPKISEQAESLVSRTQETIDRLGNDPLVKKLQSSLDEYKRAISEGSGEVAGGAPFRQVSPDYDQIPKTVLKASRPTSQRLSQMAEAGVRSDAENLARANSTGFNPYDTAPRSTPVTSSEVFDATQRFKQQLQEWNKFSPIAPPPISDRAFIAATKTLSHEFRTALENPETWGRVAELQTKLNKAWSETIPAVKDIESKFMSKVGNDRVVDPSKFNTYVNQNGKSTSTTIRQQMMGKFLDAMDKFHDATSLAYETAGIPNPNQTIGLSALKESLEKRSPWAKLADLYYDRALSSGAGLTAGAGVGGALGHATGIPGAGLAGSVLGGKLGEKILPAIIQPLMTKSLNSGALQQAVKFSESVIKGNSQLIKSSANLFSATSKTVPEHFMPNEKSRGKLDKSLEYAANHPASMFDVGGDVGHYMPAHQTALAQHAQAAVTYLNSLRPNNPQMSPLDSKIPPSKDQIAKFNRQLDVAEQPLLVLHHVKQSTLLPQDMVTLKTVYPALYPKMAQEVTNAMTDHLSKGEIIPYRLRQSLSQFLEQPLDSTMTPASILAIQASFQTPSRQTPQAGQQPSSGTGKKSTQKLSKIAMDTQTQNQARESRANKA